MDLRNAFVLYGVDVWLDLGETSHSQLDQQLNMLETLVHSEMKEDLLAPSPLKTPDRPGILLSISYNRDTSIIQI